MLSRSVSDDALAIAPVRVTTIALFSARTFNSDALMVPTVLIVLIVARASSLRLMTDTAPARPKPVGVAGRGANFPPSNSERSCSCPCCGSFETTAAASDRATRLPEFTASTLTGPAAESANPLSVRGVSVGGPTTPTIACVSRDTILTAIETPNPVFSPSKTPPAMV